MKNLGKAIRSKSVSNNDNYIRLPCLQSISVQNYALFSKDWSYKIQDGLNLFLGANGFGKTTTANLIIYGIVGIWEEREVNTRGKEVIVDQLSEDYFSAKEYNKQRERIGDTKPSVIIEFDIKSTHIKVRRGLAPLEIIEFYLNGKEVKPQRGLSLEETYKNKIQSLCLVDNINDLSFLLRKLIIREEEGNSLLWDSEDQSKIIRLLFNPPGFFKKFYEIQKKATKQASAARRASDQKAPLEKNLKVLKEEKEKEIQRIIGALNQFEINKSYEKLTNTVSILEKSQDKLHEDINYLNGEIRNLEERFNGLSSDLDNIKEQITHQEYQYFDSIYQDPKISLIYNKIDQRKSCIFCQNHVSDDVKTKIVNLVKHNRCPVCSNTLKKEINSISEIPEKTINKIESLRQQADQNERGVNKITLAIRNAKASRSTKWEEQKVLAKQLSASKNDLNELKLVLENLKKDSEPTNQFDKAIKLNQMEISKYQVKINKHNKSFNEKKIELSNINIELNTRIDSLTNDLSDIFNEYANSFHIKDLKLISHKGRKPRSGSKMQLTTYRPFLEAKERKDFKSVSKSELIFLEYLFRMSIIKLYHSLTKERPFLILESSEGSFDIVRTGQLSKVFKQFGKNNFPFISITNLSKPDFVKSIIDKSKSTKGKAFDYKKRFFNFIDVGIHDDFLDKHKKQEKEKYTRELKQLGL
jgi:energy-coupling factor transporter ATP-binding protein EcfA2